GRLITDQQLADLNAQLTTARAKTSEMRARLERIDAALIDPSETAVINATASDLANNNPLITKLRSQYLELASREAEWSEKYGRNHLAAVNARNTMRSLRTTIAGELQRMGAGYKNDYEAATEAENLINKQLQQAIAQTQTSNAAQVT